jgi:Zn ribbon nucleic-acid-binding protein
MSNQERTDTFVQCPFCSYRESRILYAYADAIAMRECTRCGGQFEQEL